MTQSIKKFILIDDDPLNNFLTNMIIKKTLGEVFVHEFTVPENGLEFLKYTDKRYTVDAKTIIFLDINMPTLSGWEFLEAFEHLDTSIKKHYTIYILSSSVNVSDIEFANANHLVSGFIEKPLNKTKLMNSIIES